MRLQPACGRSSGGTGQRNESLRGVAKALSARGVKTARGGAWTAVQVGDILTRSGLP